MGTGDRSEALSVICAEVGFDLDRASSSLRDRMHLLAEHSEIFDDAVRMASQAREVFRYYDTTKPAEAFTPNERLTVVLATLFSDIGKTGPANADHDARRLIVEMFAVEGVKDDKTPVTEFFRHYFPADADQRIARFTALGLDPSMSIREFWNLHSGWTLAIAENAGLPPEAVAAAATHHLLENVNPHAIVGADDRFTRAFGENAKFDRAEKLVIVLDKYDAVRRRGHLRHDEAIAWLRKRLDASDRFRNDAELTTLIADVDVVFRPK